MTTSHNTTTSERRARADTDFYNAWSNLLGWMREYSKEHPQAHFEKQSDFPDYIYRMERPYDLPTTVMSATLSDRSGQPILLVSASPRHAVFKEVVVHPFESHIYRKLKYSKEHSALTEGKRPFNRESLFRLADNLFEHLEV